jgi:hypothetical protein
MASPLSLSTTPIGLYKNNQPLSFGTGFFYVSEWNNSKHIFLVTNYHVLTGNDPNERNIKEPQGDSISFYCHMEEKDPSAVLKLQIPLFTKGKPIWLEHSNEKVDIAIIPILFSLPVALEWKAVDKNLMSTDLDISPSDSVTLIGYPRMYLDEKNALPIYKTGHIASEYAYDFNGEPCFIIDISAFSGNSGSPVFSIQKNAQIVSESIIIKAPGHSVKFLGVYSAGIMSKEFLPIQEIRKIEEKKGVVMGLDMQLGIVWKANLIEEIISKNSFDNYKEIAQNLIKEKGFRYMISQGLKLS